MRLKSNQMNFSVSVTTSVSVCLAFISSLSWWSKMFSDRLPFPCRMLTLTQTPTQTWVYFCCVEAICLATYSTVGASSHVSLYRYVRVMISKTRHGKTRKKGRNNHNKSKTKQDLAFYASFLAKNTAVSCQTGIGQTNVLVNVNNFPHCTRILERVRGRVTITSQKYGSTMDTSNSVR